MRERLRQEDGVALLLALALSVALSLLVFGMTDYVTSNQRSAQASSTDLQARAYAEAALNAAYSRIQYANTTAGTSAGLNPSKPNLLGCGTGSNGASDCSTINPLCVSFAATCPQSGSYTPTIGTGAVYAYYTGTNAGSFAGLNEPASTWIIVATGYARSSSGAKDVKSLRGTVTISAASAGAVASVWNHTFLTKPLVANTCQTTFTGGSLLTAPLYVVGNLCFTGTGTVMKEVAGGQAVDLQVGGKLVLAATSDTVGDFSTNPATGITSGVVVGNCASTIGGATSGCAANFKYKVNGLSNFVTQDDPELTDTQMMSDYTTFDPGPKHTCLAGTTPAPLAANQFDFSIGAGEGTTVLPGNSGSGSSGGAFNLTPSSSYACISTSGAATGYLIWNNASSGSITVSGITVPAKTLAVNGSIFFDSPVNVTQSLTYVGTAIIMMSGKLSFTLNGQTVCAVNTNCVFSNWQGNTGHNDMLAFATLLKNSTSAIDFQGDPATFMGSLWTSPTSEVIWQGAGPVLIGPFSAGALNASGNSFTLKPMPVIKNMPVGAPVPPNVSASISPLNVVG